jgi:carotenoid cleavage dioxygenase
MPYHFFSGDGQLNAFYFENGRVRWRNRWVRTERFKDRLAAGKTIHEGSMSAKAEDMSTLAGYEAWKRRTHTANTNPVFFGGKLYMTWPSGLPYEVDPISLETLGLRNFDGKVATAMTAHPKIDPKTGEMLFYARSPIPPRLCYYAADPTGKVTKVEPIEAPYSGFLHDFLITEDYVIFPLVPVTATAEKRRKPGANVISWAPEMRSYFGIMPRSGGSSDVRWFDVDAFAQYHFWNAYNEGTKVTLMFPAFDSIYHFYEDGNEAPIEPGKLNCREVKYTIDLATGSVKREEFDDVAEDYHRVDPRYMGRKWRHTFTNAWLANNRLPAAGGSWPQNALVHYDHETGRRKLRPLRPGTWTHPEPAFIPRSADAPEGDGYLLCLLYREDENRSDIEILDTSDITAEPVATVKLPTRVVWGAHGQFAQRAADGSLLPATA